MCTFNKLANNKNLFHQRSLVGRAVQLTMCYNNIEAPKFAPAPKLNAEIYCLANGNKLHKL